MYLGAVLPQPSSGTPYCYGTALHVRMNFAVSPCMLPYKLTHKGCPLIALGASLLASLMSHSSWMGITHYGPHALLHDMFGLSSPCGAYTWCGSSIENYHEKTRCKDRARSASLIGLILCKFISELVSRRD